MCSTPKRTGVLFRSTRVDESKADYADYSSMLRRASERADEIQRAREAKREREQVLPPVVSQESASHSAQATVAPPSRLSRLWAWLNTPHYLFRQGT